MSSFFAYFIMVTFVSSIGMVLILLIKKGFKRHISMKWQCNLNLLFFVLLSLPFIPGNFISILVPWNLRNWLNILAFERWANINTPVISGEETGLVYGTGTGIGLLQDFAVSPGAAAPGYLFAVVMTVFMGVWVGGIIIFTVIALLCNRNLRILKESVKPVEDKEILSLFLRCKDESGIKAEDNILLGSSILVKTPVTIGFFKTIIILPAGERKINGMNPRSCGESTHYRLNLKLNDIRYAMLHELAHYKNKDIQINSLMCLFQILYWFNPLVYFAFKQMRLDRELACDTAILERLPRDLHIDYVKALLNFMRLLAPSRSSMFSLSANIGDAEPQIIKRIKYITSYAANAANAAGSINTVAPTYVNNNVCVFILGLFLVFCQIPIISALANNDDGRFHFQSDNVVYKDMSSFFEDAGVKGSFVLYDLNAGLYTIHNRDMSVTRVSPTSTYKIYSALIALEEGILEADSTLREWDGTMHPFEAWNQNQNLASAMRYSVNWYFHDLDVQVGTEKLHYYLTHLSYGNRNLSGGIQDFWIESSLRISPVEQVKLLRDFFRNDTVFKAHHVEAVKEALVLSESGGAVLSGKTGTGLVNERAVSGWFIGYVETVRGGFVFAAYIQGEDNAGGSMAAQITLSILGDMGIY